MQLQATTRTPITRARTTTAAAFTSAVIAVLTAAPAAATGTTVQVGSATTYGDVLENASGLPLYTLASDHDGESTCTGSCLQAWPPLTVPSGQSPTVGTGLPGTLGTAVQSDGRTQVTYNDAPLYTFAGDTAGEVMGQNVAGFTVVQVQRAPAPTTTAPLPAAPTATGSRGAPPSSSQATAPTQATTGAGTGPAGLPESQSAGSGGASVKAPHGASASALANTGPRPGVRLAALIGAGLLLVGTLLGLLSRSTETEGSGPGALRQYRGSVSSRSIGTGRSCARLRDGP